ncbi:MAG: threonine dehydratase, partial [Alphaproteobacteria bacterium]
MSGLDQLREAAELVHSAVPPTPQHCWPLLSERAGAEVWVKHENHTPIGAFKVRGGLVYTDDLRRTQPNVEGVVAATRGNHGQSVAFAARRFGLMATLVVPHGNSSEKNAAMRAFGGELIEHGHDFQAALEHAEALAGERGLHMFPSYHPLLTRGVASYALEFFDAVGDLDAIYVPIGLGSGISGVIAARDALGMATEVIGVVAENAPTYALSFKSGQPVSTNSADTMADGVACRVPVAMAVDI